MELYLIRHTAVAIAQGTCYGQSDVALANTFEQEWATIKEKLPSTPAVVYSSPQPRCRHLSAKVGVYYGLPVVVDDRLKELNFGDWEMKRWEEIHQPALHHWMDHYVTERCPNGESYTDLQDRVRLFLNELYQARYPRVLAVTHGGVIKSVETIVKGQEAIGKPIAYGGIYQYQLQHLT